MKITLLEAVVFHRMLWSELAETGIKYKHDAEFWSQQKVKPLHVRGRCFACEYISSCRNCLFIWNGDECESISAEFRKWRNAKTIGQRKKWARKIRDLELQDRYKVLLGE